MVELSRTLPPPDPEFGSPEPGLLGTDLGDAPERYQRLLANPFLGFLYVLGWLVAFYLTLNGSVAVPLIPLLLLLLIAALGFVPQFLQVHCLDCGQTIPHLRWHKHTCQKSLDRLRADRPRLIRGPSPPFQVVLWVWGLMLALVMLASWVGKLPIR